MEALESANNSKNLPHFRSCLPPKQMILLSESLFFTIQSRIRDRDLNANGSILSLLIWPSGTEKKADCGVTKNDK
jgi:hypothetical protein